VAAAAVLLAFLVLASQSTPFGQVVGALRLENGIALLELGGEHEHQSLVTQVGQLVIVVATIGLYVWLLRGFSEGASAPVELAQDEPTL
jgi:hypothetical protein